MNIKKSQFYLEYEKTISNLNKEGCKCTFELKESKLRVLGENKHNIDWCKKYFSNYFNITDSETEMSVYISTNLELISYLNENYLSGDYSLDKNSSIIVKYSETIDIIFQKYTPVTENNFAYYIVDKHKNSILVLLDYSNKYYELIPMRLIRELIKLTLIENGWVLFHAACTETNNNGIAITGNKYAGKTTTLMNFLLNGEHSCVSNDKIAIKQNGNEIDIVGFPVSAGIRLGTILMFPEIQKLLKPKNSINKLDNVLSKEDLKDFIDSKADVIKFEKNNYSSKRIFITPEEFVSSLGCSIKNNVKLKCLVMPKFDRSVTSSKINLMNVEDAFEILSQQYTDELSVNQPYWINLFNINMDNMQGKYSQLINFICKNIPVYQLKQNTNTNASSLSQINGILGKHNLKEI